MAATPRILVVDDDADVREFVSTVLSEENLDALTVPDGGAALARLSDGAYDLLLTDIRMPGLDGFELALRARHVCPELRVLFMSGYGADYHIDPDRDNFVAKPFRPRELLGCIYEILRRKGDAAGT